MMKIWDSGTYETHKFRDDEVMVTFHGERLHGRYVLFRTRGDDWMIHRMDPPEDPEREPMPEHVAPMLATHRHAPARRGGRGRSRSSGTACARSPTRRAGTLRLESRNGHDITPRYPELRELGRALGAREAILDGEVVAFDGRPPVVPEAPGPHAPDLRARGPPAGGVGSGDLHDLRPALPRRPLADGPALRGAPRRAARARAQRPDLADARPPRRRRRAAARGLARPRGSRGSSPSGSTARTRPGAARTAG